MRAPAFAFTITVVLVLGALALPDTPAQEEPAPVAVARSPKIGYVDITRVLRDYERRLEYEEDLKRSQAELVKGEQELLDQSARLRAEIDQLAMGTSERSRLEKQNAEIVEELKEFRVKNMELLNKKFVATISLLYDDVLREVNAFGQENDFDLIIKDQSSEAVPTTHDAVVLQVTKRVVLYSRPEYDLSALIAQRLNEKHKTNQARAPKETQPETPGNSPVEER